MHAWLWTVLRRLPWELYLDSTFADLEAILRARREMLESLSREPEGGKWAAMIREFLT